MAVYRFTPENCERYFMDLLPKNDRARYIEWLEIWNYDTVSLRKGDLYEKYRLMTFFKWHVVDDRIMFFYILIVSLFS